MMWKKRGISLVFLFLMGVLLVSGASDDSILKPLAPVWDTIMSIGQLDFLGDGKDAGQNLIGFMRILVVILVFTILFELSRLTPLGRNAGITVALILAIMSSIFIPGSILAAIGGTYGTVVAFLLIGIPVAGGLYALLRIPSTSVPLIITKITIICVLIWILSAMKVHVASMGL